MTTQTFWAHGSALRGVFSAGSVAGEFRINEFGSTIIGFSGNVPTEPINFSIIIPCPVNINGVQGKLLTAFLKYRHVGGNPPFAPVIRDVRLLDGDSEVGVWLPPIPMPPLGADHVERFQLHRNVTINCGLALTFRVVDLFAPAMVEIIGAGIEIQY